MAHDFQPPTNARHVLGLENVLAHGRVHRHDVGAAHVEQLQSGSTATGRRSDSPVRPSVQNVILATEQQTRGMHNTLHATSKYAARNMHCSTVPTLAPL
jgi:hypothetical protein